MQKITVEVIGNHFHRCACYSCEVPEVVQEFCRTTGTEIRFIPYRAWDIDDSSVVPDHIRAKVKAVREGREGEGDFFINGQCFTAGYHSGGDIVKVAEALYAAAGLSHETPPTKEYGRAIGGRECRGCTMDHLRLCDCAVGALMCAESQIDRLFLRGGRVGSIDIGEYCQVDSFRYRGFDINKLVNVATQHPELFGSPASESEPAAGGSAVDTPKITIRALGLDDLRSGRHPCIIVERPLDPENSLCLDAIERFGAWGYVAEHNGHVCGFLSALPKVSCIRDGSHVAPVDVDPAKTLWLRCMIGGSEYGEQFRRIGVAKSMVVAAVRDARSRGYICVEASPHDQTGHVYAKCGFTPVKWSDASGREHTFYRQYL